MLAVSGPEPTKCSSVGLAPEAAVTRAAGHGSEAWAAMWVGRGQDFWVSQLLSQSQAQDKWTCCPVAQRPCGAGVYISPFIDGKAEAQMHEGSVQW